MSSSFLTTDDYALLSRLLAFFSTSYGGENTRLKLIQTRDYSTSVCTSFSQRIYSQLKCRHLLSRLLCTAMEKHKSIYHDGGLYFSMIFCQFLIELRQQSKMTFFQTCLNLIDQMNLTREMISFNSIHPLLASVRAVICKPLAYQNSILLREQLCLLAVKAFLENITLTNSSEQQLIITIDGLDIEQSSLLPGLLYQISTGNHSSICSKRIRNCLYFTISLAGDYTIEDVDHIETEDEMFEWIERTANRIAEEIIACTCLHDGGLILCQKVIHPSVKMKLKKFGIDTIDRLGRQYTPYFCYLTGCQPIESLTFHSLDQRYFGTLTDIQRLEIGVKSFLQFSNQTRPFHTLLLCSNTEQSLLELKECIHTSHQLLNNLLLTKQVLYGGGCTESMQLLFLKTHMDNLAAQSLFRTIRHVIRALDNRDYVIDCQHGHLWLLMSDTNEIHDRCACELYTAGERWKTEWSQWSFHLDNEEKLDERMKNDDDDNSELFIRQAYPKYFDHAQMRTNAFRTAIETAMNLHLTSVCL